MVYTGIFATEAELDAKVGENVDTTGWTEANKNDWISQAQSYINCVARNNFTDNYAGLDEDVKRILSEAASNLTAIYGIQYNMAGYSSRIEAEDMINLLFARLIQCLEVLSDDRTQKFMGSAVESGSGSPLTTKGDLYTFDSANARLGVGTNGQILIADSAETTGLKWGASSGGGDMVLADIQTITGAKTFNSNTLLLNDTDSLFDLILGSTSTITTADKTLTFDVNDGNRILTIAADATISNTNTGDLTLGSVNFGMFFSGTQELSLQAATTILSGAITFTDWNIFNGKLDNIIEDTTPELGGELEAGAHTIGFTQQTATGDGATTIDWKLGNKFKFTFGAFNETFTFTQPTNTCNILLMLVQDGTGSRTATWPATVKWPGGTAPTLSTAANAIDIIGFYFDGTNYFGVDSLNFS